MERGISLNSARSVLDHLGGDGIEIEPIYFDYKKRPYRLSPDQLYSNTPSDFDFKLRTTAKKLSQTALKQLLKSCDLAFPAMHGPFGEDGGIQRLLERWKIPFVGSGSVACKTAFDKYEANQFIHKNGFFTLSSEVLKIHHTDHAKKVRSFFKKHGLKRAAVKPATGGSSIGVFSVRSAEEALEKVQLLFGKRMDTRIVMEPFCEGKEFTVIILQNRFGMPVAILPTEIETDYTENQIFDYRRKYLPTRQVKYHCPPRFDNETIERIQVQAEQLFTLFGMRDFARYDGWVLKDGSIWFSDFNPISGMEQNSFLFQQSARVGLSHRDVLRFVVSSAARRAGIKMPENLYTNAKGRKPVNVLFGGKTSERQVSLMSGTNAWLKLRRSKKFEPKPFLLDMKGEVWELPYALTLNHTVEEIVDNCENAEVHEKRLRFLEEKARLRLALRPGESSEPFFLPKKITLEKFIEQSKFVLIGLHGGMGEDGTLQEMLSEKGVKFNGPDAKASRICMDKLETGLLLKGLEAEGIFVAPKAAFALNLFNKSLVELQKELHSKAIIVKPQDEGCSSGIVRLFEEKDLETYLHYAKKGALAIPPNSFKNQTGPVEMPLEPLKNILFEKFIETDKVRVKGNRIKWTRNNGLVEVTIGILEGKDGLKAFNPSLTVAEGEVLSVEEKFQGGTGVNMTPPPEAFVKPSIVEKAKHRAKLVAEKLGIQGYCRIDAFLYIKTGEIIVIEVNTLPALTPSTVLYHQGLSEKQPIYPLQLLERIVENKEY